MKNWLNRLPKEKLQKYLFLGILGILFLVFFVTLYFASVEEPDPNPNDPDVVDPTDPDDNPPVVATEKFIAPIDGSEYQVVRTYFDESLEAEELVAAIMQYDDSKYVCSIGISLAKADNSSFNVVATLSGEVTNVVDDSLYGKTVVITHENGFVSEYSSLSEVSVSVGDKVEQGQKLGVSGECNIDAEAKNHVYFVVKENDVTSNPQTLIGKTIQEAMAKVEE